MGSHTAEVISTFQKGVVPMSTYEELSIIINVAILIVAILVYSKDKGAKK